MGPAPHPLVGHGAQLSGGNFIELSGSRVDDGTIVLSHKGGAELVVPNVLLNGGEWAVERVAETSAARLGVRHDIAALDGHPDFAGQVVRLANPSEIAELVAFTLRPSQASLNGATLDVNGGSYIR